jgi:hypothetical protein
MSLFGRAKTISAIPIKYIPGLYPKTDLEVKPNLNNPCPRQGHADKPNTAAASTGGNMAIP